MRRQLRRTSVVQLNTDPIVSIYHSKGLQLGHLIEGTRSYGLFFTSTRENYQNIRVMVVKQSQFGRFLEGVPLSFLLKGSSHDLNRHPKTLFNPTVCLYKRLFKDCCSTTQSNISSDGFLSLEELNSLLQGGVPSFSFIHHHLWVMMIFHCHQFWKD